MNGFRQSSVPSSSISEIPQAALFNNQSTQQSQVQQLPLNPNLTQQLLQATQNAMLSALPQQGNATSWINQLPQQQQLFPNNLSAQMAAFNIPFISPQIIQEAYALCSPVESSDEPLLIEHLLSYRKRNESYKDALNALHGVSILQSTRFYTDYIYLSTQRNGHSASLWKDYYLEHKDRLDARISVSLQKAKGARKTSSVIADAHNSMIEKPHPKYPMPTVKKPSPDSFKQEPSPRPTSKKAPSKRPNKNSVRKSSTPTVDAPIHSKKVGRSTFNSLTGPAPVYGSRLPPPNAEIKPPEPPSRSPTPPTHVVASHVGRGNKYTQEDREFFIKFIGWRLKQDPTLTRNDLCQALAEKAPHHTSQSWASHWSNNHDIPDKILAAARGEDFAEGYGSSDDEVIPVKKRQLYKDPSTTEESTDGENDEGTEEESDDDSDSSIRSYSESEMGVKGSNFTDADAYICCKYIASVPGWFDMGGKDRWGPFHLKYPERSMKSWAEYYRREEKHLKKIVRKIQRKENGHRSSILTQTARPSHKLPPKRKLELDEDEDELSEVKRHRIAV
ncbi:hypothetical protein CVT24_006103 [Panaeolus cyanescens]|uniref:Uncharacterized protein n=1 Tax=Panaeolus cyanescens TaxID=181874 RepID=A0A409VE66_9AGAR|nr:hypothetical protein CVT24_006103 [Panaeolus cyanescens]